MPRKQTDTKEPKNFLWTNEKLEFPLIDENITLKILKPEKPKNTAPALSDLTIEYLGNGIYLITVTYTDADGDQPVYIYIYIVRINPLPFYICFV